MIQHQKSTTYYPQGNGQAKLTNKVLKAILTKIVNANQTDCDTKLYPVLWAYCTTYKVTSRHTPFSLVFGTKALLPIQYIEKRTVYTSYEYTSDHDTPVETNVRSGFK
jgi:hypothetical protein